ncbi:hypothetical protein [Gordonibacter sp. Marseille-P4307]|uniref:hypothetical protein n=1 Tax=Gordonibacter sp. Marseille-P4307 TaxID=2161815 RepID=UPI000F542F90|nr:hypothetical protein [Gordonibacter sp. Marseille-P4307]
MTSAQPRPCPFCGGEAETSMTKNGYWSVHCTDPDCFAKMVGSHRGLTEAMWDRRADERTCRMKDGVGVTICCRCGALVSKKAVSTLTEFIPARFCPNCGARVVG